MYNCWASKCIKCCLLILNYIIGVTKNKQYPISSDFILRIITVYIAVFLSVWSQALKNTYVIQCICIIIMQILCNIYYKLSSCVGILTQVAVKFKFVIHWCLVWFQLRLCVLPDEIGHGKRIGQTVIPLLLTTEIQVL
jgi:hypothetical protein